MSLDLYRQDQQDLLDRARLIDCLAKYEAKRERQARAALGLHQDHQGSAT